MGIGLNAPLAWLQRHVHDHPVRLFATTLVMFLSSLGVLGAALYVNFTASHAAAEQACKAVNELSRKIFVTTGDRGWPLHERLKFLPSEKCEDLP